MNLTKDAQRLPEPTQECLDKEIPIELSMAGYNAFYFHCDTYHGRSNFAVCQHTIDAVVDRKMQLRSDCPGAIECGSCPALAMRKREQEAGRALYFEDRRERLKKLQEELNTPSEIKYGKQRQNARAMPTRLNSIEQDCDAFGEGARVTKVADTSKPAANDSKKLNADLVGRNLLGDAVNSMMGG